MNIADEYFTLVSEAFDEVTLMRAREIYERIALQRSKRERKRGAVCWATYLAARDLGRPVLVQDIASLLGMSYRECVKASKEYAFTYYDDIDLYTPARTYMCVRWPQLRNSESVPITTLLDYEACLAEWNSISDRPELEYISEQRLAAAYTLYACRASMIDIKARVIYNAFDTGSEVEGICTLITQLLSEENTK